MPSPDEFLMAAITGVGMGWIVNQVRVTHLRLLVIAIAYYALLPAAQQLQRALTDGSDETQRAISTLAIYSVFAVVAVVTSALLERRER